jgi:hypothetical protein
MSDQIEIRNFNVVAVMPLIARPGGGFKLAKKRLIVQGHQVIDVPARHDVPLT